MTGEVAANFIPVGGVLNRVGALGRLTIAARVATGAARSGTYLGRAAPLLARANRAANEFVGAARDRLGAMTNRVTSCAVHSFGPTTLVLTAAGLVAIASLSVGDEVLA